jgi:hypothetical protein
MNSHDLKRYEPTVGNLLQRLGALARGYVRHYRRPLLVTAAAAVTLAVGVSAAQPAKPQPRPLSGLIR